MTVDIYRPDLWHDFFLMTGGGAAALTGLVFVALSLNLDLIAHDPTHTYRAIGTLAGFSAVFATCALALMGGQDHMAVGVEWLVVAGIATIIYAYGYVRAMRSGQSAVGLGIVRLLAGAACYVAEIVGAVLLMLGYVAGIYLAAIAMTALIAFMISGAWLLVAGVQRERAE
jgi:modulator of FtsH protease